MPRTRNADSAANMSSDYRLEVHSGKQGLSHLFNDWLALAERLSNPKPSHYPYWYTAYINRPDVIDESVDFIAIYRGGQLGAVFPVGRRRTRRHNLVELSIPIAEELDIFPDITIGRDEDAAMVFKFFLKAMKSQQNIKWDLLVVRNTLNDSHISNCIRCSRPLMSIHERTGFCNYIRVDKFDEHLLFLSKNSRANLRKAKSRLDKAGTSAFECISDFPSVMEAFENFVEIEAKGWKGKSRHGKQQYYSGSAMLLNESKLLFYQNIVSAFAKTGYVELYKLILNEEVIGIQIGMLLGNTCFLLKITYDESYQKLSPGTLLLERVIQRHAGDTNITTINLVSDYSWHNVWKPSRMSYETYRCFNSTGKGIAYGIAKQLQSVLFRS